MNRAVSPLSDLFQVAALPLMVGDDGTARVLLVTSRGTKRWVIPKGWPMKGRKPHEAAALEALEEAGVIGLASKKSIGTYTYFKRRAAHFDVCQVDVYLLMVKKQLSTWREKGQREARWFTLEAAADLVQEPELVALFRNIALTGKSFQMRFGELAGQGWLQIVELARPAAYWLDPIKAMGFLPQASANPFQPPLRRQSLAEKQKIRYSEFHEARRPDIPDRRLAIEASTRRFTPFDELQGVLRQSPGIQA